MERDVTKKKKPIALIVTAVVLSLALIGMIVWVVLINKKNSAAERHIDGMYAKTMYEASDNLNNLENNLAKLMVANGKIEKIKLCGDVYRECEATAASVGNLPIDYSSVSDCTKFLNQAGDWANANMMKLIGSDTDLSRDAETIYIGVREINKVVRDIMANREEGNNAFSFKNLKTGFMQKDMLSKNSIEYPELIYDGPFSDAMSEKKFKGLESMPEISSEEAVAKAVEYLAPYKVDKVKEVGKSTAPECYELYAQGDKDIYLSVSVKGGKLINLNYQRTVKASTMGEKTAVDKALEFAAEMGYEKLTGVWYNDFNGVAFVNLASETDGVICYTDLIKVKVALDDGEILGFEATGYCVNHEDRDLSPTINEKTAKSMVSKNLKIDSVRLALIPKENKEVLCYEVTGEYKGLDYFVYINASDGSEEDILRVIDEDQGKMLL